MAVNLLQLAAGTQPFEDARLWKSLRERLGHTQIRISEMAAAKSLTFEFTPENWPDSPADLMSDQLGTAKLNGKDVPVATASELLSVVRIAGNEDISKTLITRVQTIRTCLLVTRERVSSARMLVAESMDGVVAEVERADPTVLASEQARLKEIEEELKRVLGRATASREREALLHKAYEAKARIDALADPGNELVVGREKLRDERSLLIKQRDVAEQLVDEMVEELSKRGDPQGAHVAAQRVLRHRQKRLAKLNDEFAKLAADSDLVDPDRDAIKEEFKKLGQERESLERARDEFGHTDSIRELLDEMAPPLEEAARVETVSGQILLEGGKVRLTVAEVSKLVSDRTEALAAIQKPGELQSIESKLAAIAIRIGLLHECIAKLDEIDKQIESVSVAQKEEAEAEQAAKQQGEVDEKYRGANQQLGGLQEQIDALTTKLADVSRRLGSLGNVSVEDATNTLQATLAAMMASEAELDGLQTSIPQATRELDDSVERLKKEAALVRRSIKAQEREIEAAAEVLFSHPDLAWLREAIGLERPARSIGSDREVIEDFAAARDALLGAQAKLDGVVELIDNLLGIASTLDLNDDGDRLDQRFRKEFVQAIGLHLRDALGTKSIRHALFDDAELTNVDPIAREITLATQNGPVVRPLAGFSTGEQAFAYTQARILDLPPSEKPNRLLFLDEFGAFVAADRLPALAEFLGGDEVHKLVDQVVVILPLHVDYEMEVAETTGELRKRYEQRLEQITESGYCAVELQT